MGHFELQHFCDFELPKMAKWLGFRSQLATANCTVRIFSGLKVVNRKTHELIQETAPLAVFGEAKKSGQRATKNSAINGSCVYDL